MWYNLLSCCTCCEQRGSESWLFTSDIPTGSSTNTKIFRTSCRSDPLSAEEYHERELVESIRSQTGLQIFELQDFIIEKEVGKGSNSNVCLFVRTTDKRKFAGKMLKQGSYWSLINEASIMKEVSKLCTNIACLEGITVNPKCLVLQYYKNGDLGTALMRDNEKVDRGSTSEFPFLKRLSYIRDVCNAVSFLQKSYVCHRDLAMRNLLLSDDKEHVLLTDFTLSRVVEGFFNKQITFTDSLPKLAPPETFQSGKIDSATKDDGGWLYSLKSDIYGLGMTMFEVMTKKQFLRPMHHQSYLPTELPRHILPPKHLFNRAWDLWFVIRRCWNTEIQKRPWSWEVLDNIRELLKNPVTSNTSRVYYNRYSPKSSLALNSTHSNYSAPVRWSMGSTTTVSLDMDFSEIGMEPLARPYLSLDGARNSVSRNKNTNFNLETNVSMEDTTLSISYGRHVSHLRMDRASRSFPYCDPLPNVMTRSSVTNIGYCKDRHFFDEKDIEMINQEALVISGSCNVVFFPAEQSHISSDCSETDEPDDISLVLLENEDAPQSESARESQVSELKIVSKSKGGIRILL